MNSVQIDIQSRNLVNTKNMLAFISADKENIYYLDFREPFFGGHKVWAFWQFRGISKGAALGHQASKKAAILSFDNCYQPEKIKIVEFQNRIALFIWMYWKYLTVIKKVDGH